LPGKRVVSVSLGSSKRDSRVEIELLGIPYVMERMGTDGDFQKALSLIKELDGKVDAIGLGGIDLYLITGWKKYIIRDAKKLADAAKVTPVTDGAFLKLALEKEAINMLQREGIVNFKEKRVMQITAVDRFGMASALASLAKEIVFGDLMFAFGVRIPMRSIRAVNILGFLFLPFICRLPFKMLYPVGEEQEKPPKPKFVDFFQWADVIAGDFHYIKRYSPPELPGKIIITNTTTKEDVEMLKNKGVKMLITTTPAIQGRSFGVNVWEGAVVSYLGKRAEEISEEEFLEVMRSFGWKPRVEVFE